MADGDGNDDGNEDGNGIGHWDWAGDATDEVAQKCQLRGKGKGKGRRP